MLNSVTSISAGSKKPMGTPFVRQSDLQTAARRPSVEAFERYGICGQCEVLCRDALVQAQNLSSEHEVISRTGRFMLPLAVLASFEAFSVGRSPNIVCVLANALGGDFPRNDIMLGACNIVRRYLPHVGSGQQSEISLEPEENVGTAKVERHHDGQLFIPIFAEPTEISIEGIYLSCPSIAELNKIYAKDQFDT